MPLRASADKTTYTGCVADYSDCYYGGIDGGHLFGGGLQQGLQGSPTGAQQYPISTTGTAAPTAAIMANGYNEPPTPVLQVAAAAAAAGSTNHSSHAHPSKCHLILCIDMYRKRSMACVAGGGLLQGAQVQGVLAPNYSTAVEGDLVHGSIGSTYVAR
jgi:hypothetical protein